MPRALQAAEIRKDRKFDQVLEGARRVFMHDGFEAPSEGAIARVVRGAVEMVLARYRA